MVGRHSRSPRFSYVRDFSSNIPFSYSPMFRGRGPRAGAVAARAEQKGENEGRKQAFMVGGAVLGVVAVGALIYIAAKK